MKKKKSQPESIDNALEPVPPAKLSRKEKKSIKAAAKAAKKSVAGKEDDPIIKIGRGGFGKETNLKDKAKKERLNLKLALLEFPAKMMKDIVRIKWVPKSSLGKRFVAIILFLIFFAVCYEIVDQILLVVFKSINFI